MKTVARNVLVSALLFGLLVAIDFIAIRWPRVEVELFLVVPLSAFMFLLVPLSFWWANRRLFSARSNGEFLRVLVAVVTSALFAALAFLPYLQIHARMGGQM